MTQPETPNRAELAPAQGDKFETLIYTLARKSAAAMAAHIKPDGLARVVLTESRRNPKLRECDPTSLGLCVALCAQLGLEPTGPLGHAYLIPRNMKGRMECTIIVGYKGYAELARRSGQIKRMDARAVYEGDLFEFEYGPYGTFRHVPGKIRERVTHAYAWVETKDGGIYMEVLDFEDIEARRKRGASGSGAKTPWDTDYAAMARKSALRALFSGGLVPMSAELVAAIEHERESETIDAVDLGPVQISRKPARTALGLPDNSDIPGDVLVDTDHEPERVEPARAATKRADAHESRDTLLADLGDNAPAAESYVQRKRTEWTPADMREIRKWIDGGMVSTDGAP